ncbi:hypothetical protein [Rhodovulum euryhalinum]|uniref:Uncharacterized protein n=1 Tax=Rhodovulum euryhalinum TaxID=35805 RepID=A0A4R2L1S5_9RHOB|nr:hypothetical protein [Rhodovulum euryhalinum]TCO72975.1 hypothetical protein EV655_103204 [Rhodovulum euryhalinum]
MRLAVILALALAAQPALAQPVTLGEYPAIQTRFGLVSVGPISEWENGVFFEGMTEPLAADRWVTLRGAFARGDEAHDWVVIETNHGGNMCPLSFRLFKVSQGRVDRSDPFGECLGPVREVRLEAGRIEMDIDDPDIQVDIRRFAYDGVALAETAIAPDPSRAGPAGAGQDVTRWLAEHASAIFNDPSEQARFGTIMSLPEFEELRRRVNVGGNPERRGDWVFGAGCMAHQCNAVAGIWGLRISDGAPAAVFLDAGQPPRFFGHPDVLSDPSVAAFAAERALP